jgi:hypothetical protein
MMKNCAAALSVLISAISLAGCNPTKPEEKAYYEEKMPDGPIWQCQGAPHVITASNEHIIIDFRINDSEEANRMAKEWCITKGSKPKAVEENTSCGSCCRSSYQCR